MASELLANNFAVQLASGCAQTDTTITVTAAAPTALQGGQFRVLIDQEYMLVTGGASGTTWNVTRGSGTGEPVTPSQVSHQSGSWVTHVLTAGALFGGNLGSVGNAISALTTGPLTPVLTVLGHSYAEGSGTSDPNYRWSSRLAALIGADEDNLAIAGSTVQPLASPSAALFNRVNAIAVPSSAGPYGPPVQLAAIYTVINDMTQTAVNADPTLAACQIRYAIHRLRAQMCDPVSASSWAFAQGTGSSPPTTISSSEWLGGSVKQMVRNGNTWTITLPSTFPGGNLEIWGLNDSATGATHTVTVDGNPYGSFSTAGQSQGSLYSCLNYINGLSAGSHTIVGTISNIVGFTDYMCCWQLASADAPIVAYASVNKALAYPTGAHTIVDADVDAMNAVLSPIAAEFSDGRVIYVNTDAALAKTAAYFDSVGGLGGNPYAGSANVHPNDTGHGVLAHAFYTALQPVLRTRSNPEQSRTVLANAGFVSMPQVRENADQMMKPRSGQVTLVAGSGTFTSRAITANTRAILSRVTTGGTLGHLSCVVTASSNVTAGTVAITSSSATDTSVIQVLLYEAA